MRHGNDDAHNIVPLLDAYALTPPIQLTSRADGGKNNHMVRVRTGAGVFYVRSYTSLSYADPAAIGYENDLLAWLAGRPLSFAVPLPVLSRDGERAVSRVGRRLALTPQFPGEPLDPERRDHAELLGAAVGELQAALAEHLAALRPGRALFGELLRFSLPTCDPLTLAPHDLNLADMSRLDGLCGRWREEAAFVESFVATTYRGLPAQLCHNDITHSNVLVNNGRVSAVLDFEFATVTPRSLDLVQGLRLSMRILDGPDPFAAARRFMRGYGHWQSLTATEVQALPWLIRLRAALVVVWWLAQLPESRRVIPDRLEMVDQTAAWVGRNGDRLVAEIAAEALT